jgi:ribosomal protein S18 acetylase RimI-like enzyme
MPSVRIRSAVRGDAATLGRVMVASWLSSHRGQMPDEAWRRRVADWTPQVSAQGWVRVLVDQANGDAPRDVLLVADDHAGELVGLVYGRPANGGAALTAEVAALYVDPARHRQGIGAALLHAAALELSQLGFSTVRLEVLSANLPACAFYEHMGGHEVGQGAFDEDGYLLPVSIYEWKIGQLGPKRAP